MAEWKVYLDLVPVEYRHRLDHEIEESDGLATGVDWKRVANFLPGVIFDNRFIAVVKHERFTILRKWKEGNRHLATYRRLIQAKICFMEKEEVSTHFLKKFQFMLTNLSPSIKYIHLHFLKKKIKVAKCVDEIFDILEPYWHYKEYALLEWIIEEVGTSELQKEMKEYILKFEEFEKKIAVEDYYSAILLILISLLGILLTV